MEVWNLEKRESNRFSIRSVWWLLNGFGKWLINGKDGFPSYSDWDVKPFDTYLASYSWKISEKALLTTWDASDLRCSHKTCSGGSIVMSWIWWHSEALLISRGDQLIMPPDQQQPSSESVSTDSRVKLTSSTVMPPDHQQGSSGFVSTDLVIDFVAGGLGAAASVIVGQPLDTVKVWWCCNASQDIMTKH